MHEFKILFISELNNNIFEELSNEFEQYPFSSQVKYDYLKFKEFFDFKLHKDIVKEYDLIVLNVDQGLCLKGNRKFEYELQYLIDKFSNKLILLINEKCEIRHFTLDITEEVRHIFTYKNIHDIRQKLARFIRNFLRHNEGFLSKDLLKDVSKAEHLLREKEKELEKLIKSRKLKNEQESKQKKLLEEETKNLKEKIQTLEKEKQKETDNIEKIITFLAAMPKEISEEQNYLEKRRNRFTTFGGFFLSFSVLLALALISNVLFGNKLELPIIDKVSQYLAYALSVGFPMAISLLFYRQANIKSKEIEKINEKSILVQQVENALNSYNVLLSGDELKEKTISSIDRVIDKVFENNKAEKEEKVEENKLSISDIQKIFKMGNDITKG